MTTTPVDLRARCTELAADTSLTDAQRLHALFDLSWDYDLQESPEMATFMGETGGDDRWGDQSPEAIARRKAEADAPLAVLDAVDRSALGEVDQLSYDLFRYNLEVALEGLRFPSELQPLDQMSGVQTDVAMILTAMPLGSAAGLANVVERLRRLPDLIDQTIELMSKGLADGVTPPQITLRDVPEQVRAHMADGPANPLLAAFADVTPSIPAKDVDALRAEATAVLSDGVIPAYGRLHRFLTEDYLSGARTEIAAHALPDGEAWYAHLVRSYTTTDLTPKDIHEIGLSEVARIRSEMEKVMAETGFTGSFDEFTEHLRVHDDFYCDTPAQLLMEYRDIAKRIDPELCRLFGRLPRLPYGVIPVPAHSEKSQTTVYYLPGAPDAGRPGYFYANTYDLRSRPRWEMEALTLHEAVPGHHLQIAISQELEGLPKFRTLWSSYTAYVEGWGLYAESLGPELGMYKDPYSRFGQLVYEMWRAVRLVVDTGMHALGWTREQAIQLHRDQTGKPDHDIVVEVDRYIAWPGQALAYKLGELKIKELRAAATDAHGDAFDVRAFHDVVLGAGALPLEVLDRHVRTWIGA